MNTFGSFTAFIVFAVAILNIILFFKIWGMTNNVKILRKIAEKFSNMKYLTDEDQFVNYSESSKLTSLIDEKDRLYEDIDMDSHERKNAIKDIDRQIQDLYL